MPNQNRRRPLLRHPPPTLETICTKQLGRPQRCEPLCSRGVYRHRQEGIQQGLRLLKALHRRVELRFIGSFQDVVKAAAQDLHARNDRHGELGGPPTSSTFAPTFSCPIAYRVTVSVSRMVIPRTRAVGRCRPTWSLLSDHPATRRTASGWPPSTLASRVSRVG
jgi:hypothetical protein